MTRGYDLSVPGFGGVPESWKAFLTRGWYGFVPGSLELQIHGRLFGSGMRRYPPRVWLYRFSADRPQSFSRILPNVTMVDSGYLPANRRPMWFGPANGVGGNVRNYWLYGDVRRPRSFAAARASLLMCSVGVRSFVYFPSIVQYFPLPGLYCFILFINTSAVTFRTGSASRG